MINKLSSENQNYKSGQLSVFPQVKDTEFTLFKVSNNAVDYLRQTLPINGKYLILTDSSKFANSGIIKITPSTSDNLLESHEVIFYGKKIGNQLHMLQRGYNGTPPRNWPIGSKVSSPLMAEHHNALKDAIIKIQQKVGLSNKPTSDSIHGILNYLENKWLAPKPIFKGFPKEGPSPLTVNFHNFSLGYAGRFLWDFGDGTTSTDKNPIHTYTSEGKYTVKLIMITPSGSQGLVEKKEYVEVNNELFPSFFYVNPLQGMAGSTEFSFVDQTDGDITERHWFFGDGKDLTVNNSNVHLADHIYEKPGIYIPSLIIRLSNNKTKRMFFSEGINVL